MEMSETLQTKYTVRPRLLEFCRDALRPTSWSYLGWLILATILAVGAYYPFRNTTTQSIYPAIFLYYLVVAVHVTIRLKSGGRANLLSPDILFVIFYTMFHLGYVTLYALNILPFIDGIFLHENAIPKAMLVVNLGIIGFFFGYEVIAPKRQLPIPPRPIRIPTQNWTVFGLVIMIAGAAMHIGSLLFIGAELLTLLGYRAVAAARGEFPTGLAMLLTQSNHLFLFGTVIYMVASGLRYGKSFHSKLALGIFVTMLGVYVLEGDREYIVEFLLIFLFVRHFFVKRVRIRYLIILYIATMTVLAGLALVRRIAFDPRSMWQAYQYKKQTGQVAWFNVFVESGSSIRCTILTCEHVPTHDPYWYGKSYLSAGLHIFPFLEGYFIKRGTFGLYYWPSVWASASFDHGQGAIGYTIATEGYLNFGFPGVFFLLMFLGGMMRLGMVWFAKRPSAAFAFIMITWIIYFLWAVRNHIEVISGYCFFQAPIIAAFAYLVCKYEPQVDDDYLYSGGEENPAFLESLEFESDPDGYAPQPS